MPLPWVHRNAWLCPFHADVPTIVEPSAETPLAKPPEGFPGKFPSGTAPPPCVHRLGTKLLLPTTTPLLETSTPSKVPKLSMPLTGVHKNRADDPLGSHPTTY